MYGQRRVRCVLKQVGVCFFQIKSALGEAPGLRYFVRVRVRAEVCSKFVLSFRVFSVGLVRDDSTGMVLMLTMTDSPRFNVDRYVDDDSPRFNFLSPH
jgi:hypothetical protein